MESKTTLRFQVWVTVRIMASGRGVGGDRNIMHGLCILSLRY